MPDRLDHRQAHSTRLRHKLLSRHTLLACCTLSLTACKPPAQQSKKHISPEQEHVIQQLNKTYKK